MTTETCNDYIITQFDAENWWNFLMREYPENYKCACQYYTDKDPDLELEGCKPGNFYINDYFVICELPRIKATNGIIQVNNKPVKRYGGFDEWKRKRVEFEKLKELPLFWAWKREQYRCQDKKCAWCKKYLFSGNVKIHVDHVKPLIYDGTNDLSNLVVACADCNCHKGARTEGFNEGMRDRKQNSVPSWIKHNSFSDHELPYIEVTESDIQEYSKRNRRKAYHNSNSWAEDSSEDDIVEIDL